MSRKAAEHKRNGRSNESERVQGKAEKLALEMLSEHPLFNPDSEHYRLRDNLRLLQEHIGKIEKALNGESKPLSKPDKFNRVFEAVNDFSKTEKRLPSNKELRERGVRAQDLTDVTEAISKMKGRRVIKEDQKTGRKPKN